LHVADGDDVQAWKITVKALNKRPPSSLGVGRKLKHFSVKTQHDTKCYVNAVMSIMVY
jgi:hypothetical protein